MTSLVSQYYCRQTEVKREKQQVRTGSCFSKTSGTVWTPNVFLLLNTIKCLTDISYWHWTHKSFYQQVLQPIRGQLGRHCLDVFMVSPPAVHSVTWSSQTCWHVDRPCCHLCPTCKLQVKESNCCWRIQTKRRGFFVCVVFTDCFRRHSKDFDSPIKHSPLYCLVLLRLFLLSYSSVLSSLISCILSKALWVQWSIRPTWRKNVSLK